MLSSLRICLIVVLFIVGGLSTPSGSNSVKVSKYVNWPCNNDKYCHSVTNTNCQNGRCKCLSGYIQDRNYCLYKLSKFRSDCKSNYVRHNDVCYGLPGAECSNPSDCFSSSYSCVSGTCQNVDHRENDKLISKKPGISSYWIENAKSVETRHGVLVGSDQSFNLHVCRIKKDNTSVPGKLRDNNNPSECHAPVDNKELFNLIYELLIGSDVEWKTIEYTFDKAIYGGHDDKGMPYLICRAQVNNTQDVASGMLEPPLYNTCINPYNWTVTPYSKFDILVHK